MSKYHSIENPLRRVFRLPALPALRLAVLLAVGLGSANLSPAMVQAQNLPTLGDTSREDLSPLAERKLGEQIMSVVRRDPDYMDDAPVSEYLNRLGNKMLEARPDARGETNFNFEFFAVRDPVLNAFAFPGGFIGFHSGLILAAQSESELASVMGHEIGHVAQRHIARMLTSQRGDALIPLAALALAVLAARSSPDAAMAIATGGQGLAIQKQLNFGRDAEREADRVGFQILRDSGFDPSGMVNFFGRLQSSMRNYNDNLPPFLRSHPLTSERIADIQSRLSEQRYRQHADSLEFLLTKARIRVLQDSSTQGLMDASTFFDTQAKTGKLEDQITAKYGQAFIAYKRLDFATARKLLDQSRKMLEQIPAYKSMLTYSNMYVDMSIDILIGDKQTAAAGTAPWLALAGVLFVCPSLWRWPNPVFIGPALALGRSVLALADRRRHRAEGPAGAVRTVVDLGDGLLLRWVESGGGGLVYCPCRGRDQGPALARRCVWRCGPLGCRHDPATRRGCRSGRAGRTKGMSKPSRCWSSSPARVSG